MSDMNSFSAAGARQPSGKPLDYYKQIDDAKRTRSEQAQKVIKSRKAASASKASRTGAENKTNKSQFKQLIKNNLTKNTPATPDGKNDKNGTDIALKRIASEYNKQIHAIMWNMIFNPPDKKYEGGMGEKIFSQELVMELVKDSTSEDSPLATAMYEELKENNSNKHNE